MQMVVTDTDVVKKYSSMESSAKSRGIPFSMSLTKVRQLMTAQRCYYTGVVFDDSKEETKRSADRVESDGGYTDDNVVPCTVKINQLKSNMTYADVLAIERGMRRHRQKLRDRKNLKKNET